MQCLLCKENKLTEFLDLGRQPLANKYPASEADFQTEDFFPLVCFFCSNCRNVQLGTIVSRERMFEDYYYLSSVNPGLVRHFEALAKTLADSKFVVDIGSNDGILLRPLKDLGVKAVGVDPSVNVSKIANEAGLETIVAFFDEITAQKIISQYGRPDTVVASSIFTHLENPHEFTKAVKNLMREDGQFIVEVEYIGNILKKVQFERFYLDRIFYYSVTSLKHLFEGYGMHLADVAEIDPHGGSIRVIVKNTQNGEESERVKTFLQQEEQMLNAASLAEFKKRVDEAVGGFRKKLEDYKSLGLKAAGYGSPARVATICNYAKIGPSLIEYIVDDSPLKQNRHSPGTHIPIVPPERLQKNRPDVLVVFAYEYFDDIRKKTNHERYLIPIPPREVVNTYA